MEININKFNKWRQKSGLDIELITEQWTEDSIPESSLRIRGYMEDITKCLVILMDHWDKMNNGDKMNNRNKVNKKNNKKKKVQYIKADE